MSSAISGGAGNKGGKAGYFSPPATPVAGAAFQWLEE
jgi:hypothetical protein